jgi:hypothetical protein
MERRWWGSGTDVEVGDQPGQEGTEGELCHW